LAAAAGAPAAAIGPAAQGGGKSRAAGLSIASNATLIALKIAAGAITGSIAIITEAIHSSIDLLASIVAFLSVRKADEAADASPALESAAADLRTDALTSFGVLVALVLVEATGVVELDPITALVVAAAIVFAGTRILSRSSRVLVD